MKIPGLVLAAFCAALVASAARAQTAEEISVKLTSYAFTPSTITLKAGKTYRLHLTNGSQKGHDFTAAEFFAASTVAPEDKAKLEEDSEVEVGAGKSVDVTVTPTRAGTYPLTCSHFLHSTFGMTGTIIVQ
ncbi:MAG TPA: cupredoxin domain-containing protein [Rhizomicrobium sp.]|nr:cupredoxin domain-containing protein [Rhizomicrobium sp.]